MEEKNNRQIEVINIRDIIQKIWAGRMSFVKPLGVVFVVACIYIFSQPRYYTTDAKLAPEMGSSMSGGTLGTIASAFGFDFSGMQTSDAITPLLYPDLMDDNAFVAKLFTVKVVNQEGDIKATYYDYLKKHQKKAWWKGFTGWFTNLFKSKPKGNTSDEFNPYNLSESDNNIAEAIRNSVKLSVNKKTGVMTLNVQDQDPRICKTLADSIMNLLQIYITDYRTNKARTDYEYYKKLAAEARQDYEKTRRQYANMADAITNVSLRSVQLKMEDLENDMQMKFNTYQTINAQLQAANAKVQERTPVFTILKGASIPLKPAGPKRVAFVFAMLILAFVAKSFWMIKDDLHFRF